MTTVFLTALTVSACYPESKSNSGPDAAETTTENDPRNTSAVAVQGGENASRTVSETAIFSSQTTSLSDNNGVLLVPSIEDIPEVPANVALTQFFASLSNLEQQSGERPVTILHVGDSHIAADRFSSSLREQFQSRFGDAGRGLMMPSLYLARGVKFDRGGKWKVSLSTGGAEGPFGVTGAKVSSADNAAWIRLTMKDKPFSWCEITLDSGPENGTVMFSLDGQVKEISTTGENKSWRNIRLEGGARELLIRPKGDGEVTIHSISIGGKKTGVRYINLGLPGATALTPLRWDVNYLENDVQRLQPDMVILSYGTHESLQDDLNIPDYEAQVSVAISRLRRVAPNASLIVIGPPDISVMPKYAARSGRASDVCRDLSQSERANYDAMISAEDPRLARWHPPRNLTAIRASLRRLAAAHNAFFWDWSKPMGGACGIHAWVQNKPALAAKDHIHLTEEGSQRSARILFREIMTAYDARARTASADK
ncbi:MAG: hypothetical protein KTR19_01685 [Hyphomicrobiales bacterium]|nr:hypothetical protein [Hyphomicrobiales bacterium]